MGFLVSLSLIFLGVFASVAHSLCDVASYFKCGNVTQSPSTDGERQIKSSNVEYKLFYCDSITEFSYMPTHGQIFRGKQAINFSLPLDVWNWPSNSSCVRKASSFPTPLPSSTIFRFYGCDSLQGLPELRQIKKCGLYDWGTLEDPHVVNSCKIGIEVVVMNAATLAVLQSSTNSQELWTHLQMALSTGFKVFIPQPSPPKKGLDLKMKLIIAFSVCGGTALIMCAIFFIYQRRKKRNYAPSYFTRNVSSDLSSINDPEKMGAVYGVKFFTYDELEEATDSFDEKREIGDGGFGTVYLGKLKDGRTVAVKRLYENNYKRVEQFLNEVEILTRLRHKNLVMLYGCTSRHSRELLLVYEYVSNGTVADHVHGRNAKPGCLPWGTRLKIAVETASALKYLHASDIIHRDVKTNNILLDDNFNVKVADFGLSRLFPLDVTHVSTAPQGTPGYVDPEYHQCYQLTDKSDVYSFGVVLVELISSKPAVDITRHRHEINLSNMAINKIQSGTLQELVDPSLGFDEDCNVHKSVTAVAELAFQCLQSDKDMRPTMEEVLEILTRIQCGDSHTEDKAEELDIFSDEFVLLKSGPLPLSPDSVTVKWASGSVASSSSC